MLADFLSHSHTTALCDRNFKEWHEGIPYYGFWAVLIDSSDLMQRVLEAQSHLQHFFLPDYKRQAHITLNACGLMTDTRFSNSLLDRQITALKQLTLSPFNLSVTHIDSFSTAAYLAIEDQGQVLHKINTALSDIASDSKPSIYKPHITLGLYREAFQTEKVAQKIIQFNNFKPINITIGELQFCRYKTSSIQGQIEVIKKIKLAR